MTEQEQQVTVIGPDTQIKGEMTFERTAKILGRFEGHVTSGGELQVGATAHCTASLDAATVIVDGQVEGNIAARDLIQLNRSARVSGDVVAEKLVVAEGASFSGRCCVGPDAVAEMQAKDAANGVTQATPQLQRTGERPTVEVKANSNGASAFDWVGKQGDAGGALEQGKSSGWGPRTAATDGAA